MLNAKSYMEHRIKDIKDDIERAERDFENSVNLRNRSYEGIIQKAQHIIALQNELKGMETALDVMISCEKEED